MTREEYLGLEAGDQAWYFDIDFSVHGNIYYIMVAKLEKIERKNLFKVLDIRMGSSWKIGETVSLRDWTDYQDLFKDYNDGVEHWNSIILNKIDYMTSIYEKMVKRAKDKLLEKII